MCLIFETVKVWYNSSLIPYRTKQSLVRQRLYGPGGQTPSQSFQAG